MAPLMDEGNAPDSEIVTASQPRFAIIGAGSRGNAYARATVDAGLGVISAVVDPIEYKRKFLGTRYIWPGSKPAAEQEFSGWDAFIKFELQRRKDEAAGIPVTAGVDGVFICVRDELHTRVVTALAPLELHILCEKPLATTLDDCLRVQRTLESHQQKIFAIGHVLRYSPHNMLLRHLLLEKQVIGEVLSVEHTEPVGWWHFSHSYVRGNWRKESYTAPSLLTKSCHDVDWLMWMLCSPLDRKKQQPHLPSTVSSIGSLKQFRKSRKPVAAGSATNCLSCPIERSCIYSAPQIYRDRHLNKGLRKWPVDIVNPEVEDLYHNLGVEKAKEALTSSLAEDYDKKTPVQDIESRAWYGRCVWESDNDVCDDQHVLFEWEDESASGRQGKTAAFHMIAQTLAQCERRGRIYGTSGEIEYDSKSITVHDFTTNTSDVHHPEVPKNSHHGGGDDGLTQQFIKAVGAVRNGTQSVEDAQIEYLGVTVEECVRSHAAVFAAEEARRSKQVVRWDDWWRKNIDGRTV